MSCREGERRFKQTIGGNHYGEHSKEAARTGQERKACHHNGTNLTWLILQLMLSHTEQAISKNRTTSSADNAHAPTINTKPWTMTHCSPFLLSFKPMLVQTTHIQHPAALAHRWNCLKLPPYLISTSPPYYKPSTNGAIICTLSISIWENIHQTKSPQSLQPCSVWAVQISLRGP